MNSIGYEEKSKYIPLIQTSCSLLKTRGKKQAYSLLSNSKIKVVKTKYANWNGEIYEYTLYLNISSVTYASFSSAEISSYEEEIEEAMNETIKGDQQSYFKTCISPIFTVSDTDWHTIGGEGAKRQLKKNIEEIQNIMVSVATGGPKIETEDTRYKQLNNLIRKDLDLLNIQYMNPHASLWDWYGEWKGNLHTYKERREYVRTLFANLVEYFAEDNRRKKR